jgi:hypothetical protein
MILRILKNLKAPAKKNLIFQDFLMIKEIMKQRAAVASKICLAIRSSSHLQRSTQSRRCRYQHFCEFFCTQNMEKMLMKYDYIILPVYHIISLSQFFVGFQMQIPDVVLNLRIFSSLRFRSSSRARFRSSAASRA